jgi:hypothetical protein
VPIDQEQLRAERVRVHQANRAGDWSQREKLIVDAARAEFAETRAREQHDAELAAAVTWAERKSAAASKAGNSDEASLCTAAAESIKAGEWPISRRISADPEVMRFAGLRSTLNYAGKNRRLDD